MQTCEDAADTDLQPFVSVIIPVYNDADRLNICLTALHQQTYDSDRYEIIIIDNGSDSSQAMDNLKAKFNKVVYEQELIPGSYAARNKGIIIAKGDVIAFTDSDCIPVNDWIEKGVKYLTKMPNCGLVAGRIEMFFKDPNHPNLCELYDRFVMDFPQKAFLEKRGAAFTANIFTWKHVLDKVGYFLTDLKSFGDQEWGKRVHGAGYGQIYADDACVYHPTRYTMADLHRRTLRLSGGIYDMYVAKEPLWWKRYGRVVKLVINDLFKQPIKVTNQVIQDDRINNFSTKLKIVMITYFMQFLSAYEKVRLKAGGESER